MRQMKMRVLRPTPALVVAFIALFAAMGGIGYSAVKLKPNSIKTKNLRTAAVTRDKLADGSVTTAKLAPDAVAPNARNAANAMTLGGVAPGGCHVGWLKASVVVDTSPLTPTLGEPSVVPGFDCASKADDAVQIQREAVGIYTVTFAGNDSGSAVVSSAGTNSVAAATKVSDGVFTVKTWSNATGAFADNTSFSLIAF
jgi:hypothetical protein